MHPSDRAAAGLVAVIVLTLLSPFALAASTPLWVLAAVTAATFAATLML